MYVIFVLKNVLGNYDYWFVKYDSIGVMLWDIVYNYVGLGDIFVSVYVSFIGGVVVCGVS